MIMMMEYFKLLDPILIPIQKQGTKHCLIQDQESRLVSAPVTLKKIEHDVGDDDRFIFSACPPIFEFSPPQTLYQPFTTLVFYHP